MYVDMNVTHLTERVSLQGPPGPMGEQGFPGERVGIATFWGVKFRSPKNTYKQAIKIDNGIARYHALRANTSSGVVTY